LFAVRFVHDFSTLEGRSAVVLQVGEVAAVEDLFLDIGLNELGA
jgi:hypothetical protein